MTYNTVVFLCTRDEGLILTSFALVQSQWLGRSCAAFTVHEGKREIRLRKGCACFKQLCPSRSPCALLPQHHTLQTRGSVCLQCMGCPFMPAVPPVQQYLSKNYFNFHHLSPSVEKSRLASLTVGQNPLMGFPPEVGEVWNGRGDHVSLDIQLPSSFCISVFREISVICW